MQVEALLARPEFRSVRPPPRPHPARLSLPGKRSMALAISDDGAW